MKRWGWIKFLGIELSCVGIKVMDYEFPWKDVDTCMDNEVEPPIEGMRVTCPTCGRNYAGFVSVVLQSHG